MGATEETVKDALAKGAKSISLKGLLSDGIGNLVGGVTSLGGGLAAVLASVAGVAIPALLAGVAVYAGKSLWDNVLTNNNANKKYEKSSQKYDNAVSERDSLQSEYDSNKERYYELNAKENRSTDEQAELENLASKNSLMESQLKVKDNIVDATQRQQALDAKDALEKSGLHTNKKRDWYNRGLLTGGVKYQDDIDEANDMVEKLNRQKAEREELISNEGSYNPEKFKKKLASIEKKISATESDLTDSVSDISDKAQDLWDDNGNLIDESAKDTAKRVTQLTDDYKKAIGSTSTTSDKMNNIFALSQFSDLKDKLIAAGKSGGTDAIKKMIKDTDGLGTAMNNAGLTADDLAASIMSIADPDAKNLEGIKENLEDIFGKDGLGQSDFFKGKTDEELENFWDYLQDNNYNPKQMSFSDPPKALLCFRMISFAATDFFVTRRVPGFWPICLPANLAVSIPSAVLWCKSCTSFSACSNASLICSFANARRYLFTPSRIKSTLVPVVGIPPCKALLYVSVLMCGSFRNTRLMP